MGSHITRRSTRLRIYDSKSFLFASKRIVPLSKTKLLRVCGHADYLYRWNWDCRAYRICLPGEMRFGICDDRFLTSYQSIHTRKYEQVIEVTKISRRQLFDS